MFGGYDPDDPRHEKSKNMFKIKMKREKKE